ncbi:type I-U CRISPR-associated protein Csb2 [Desulfovibrionales bacterium]
MPGYLCISIYFLGDEFHGRNMHGEPEWPPSPLRLFQTLVAVNARMDEQASSALVWLEQQDCPHIVSPAQDKIQAHGYKTYVPDNAADLVAHSWVKGGDKDISSFRSEKYIRSFRMMSHEEKCPSIHYLWPLADEADRAACAKLFPVVRGISQFGWGIDMVVANASIISGDEAGQFVGQRWVPTKTSGGEVLRVPVQGTLKDLRLRYQASLKRISLKDNVFRPVPPLSCFSTVTYRRADEIDRPPFAVFALRKPDDSSFSAFATAKRGLHLSGMLRHAASRPDFAVPLGWDEKKIASFVLGHGESRGASTHNPVNDARLVFVPLPSIEWRGESNGYCVGAIRRVLVTVSGHIGAEEFARIVRNLEGRELINEKTGQVVAFLRHQGHNEGAIRDYFQPSSVWTTVTPVILPGFDDPGKLRRRMNSGSLTSLEKANIVLKLEARIDALMRKALRQAAYPEELVRNAEILCRGSGFMPGTDLAGNYAVPDQHRRFRRMHVYIAWRDEKGCPVELSGPICAGGGRFGGMGLFVST